MNYEYSTPQGYLKVKVRPPFIDFSTHAAGQNFTLTADQFFDMIEDVKKWIENPPRVSNDVS